MLSVRTVSEINSGTAKEGDRFDATLTKDLVFDGKTVAKAGAPVKGKVTYVKSSGRLHEPGELTLRLTSVEVNGKMRAISSTAYHGALIGSAVGAGAGTGVAAATGKEEAVVPSETVLTFTTTAAAK